MKMFVGYAIRYVTAKKSSKSTIVQQKSLNCQNICPLRVTQWIM